MKKEPIAEKVKNVKTESSITVSSQTVCEDLACIGKSRARNNRSKLMKG